MSFIFNTLAAVSLLGVILVLLVLGYQYLDNSTEAVVLEEVKPGASKVTIATETNVATSKVGNVKQTGMVEVISIPTPATSTTPVKAASTPVVTPTIKPKQLISLYPDDSDKHPAFTTLENNKEEIIVLSTGPVWTQILSSRGLPVWIRNDMVKDYRNGFVEVTVNSARTRSTPNTQTSAIMGIVSKGEVMKVNRKQENWIRVWSPIRFRTWVKTDDLEAL